MKQNNRFRHESLQDQDSIKELLSAVVEGLAKGKIVLEDENGTMTMMPKGMLQLKLTGSQEDEQNRLDIRIKWKGKEQLPKKKDVKISSK